MAQSIKPSATCSPSTGNLSTPPSVAEVLSFKCLVCRAFCDNERRELVESGRSDGRLRDQTGPITIGGLPDTIMDKASIRSCLFKERLAFGGCGRVHDKLDAEVLAWI